MGGVQTGVAHKQIGALQLHRGTAIDIPVWIVVMLDLKDVIGVSEGGVAQTHRLTQLNVNPLVAAFDRITLDAALREGKFTVRARVLRRDQHPRL